MRTFAAALLLSVPLAALATPTDFNFKDVEVQAICQTIGVLGKFNVVVDPAISRGKLTLALRQVEPLDALNDVARQAGAAVSRIRYEEGSVVVSYMIGRAGDTAREGRTTRTIPIKYASAAQIVKALGSRIEAITGEKPSVDERTNRLIVSGSYAAIGQVDKLIDELDRAVPDCDLIFAISENVTDLSSQLWSASASVSQGRVARFTLSSGVRPQSNSLVTVADLEGKFQTRVSPAGVCSVALNVTGKVEKDGVKHAVHWSTEVQVQEKGTAECGAIEIPGGGGAQLELSVTLQRIHQAVAPSQVDDLSLDSPLSSPAPTAPASPASPQGGDLDLEGI